MLKNEEHELPVRGDNDSGPRTLENSNENDTYLSPQIQNKIIDISDSIIQIEIVKKLILLR